MTTVLGYQLRVPVEQLPLLWTARRRAEYLLVPHTEAPLSADTQVWPIANCPEAARQLFSDFVSGPNEAPNGLDVFQLKRGLAPTTLSTTSSFLIVGIAADHEVATRLRAKNFIIDPTINKTPVEMGMQSLGYDVCDEHLTSGLMNCGLATAAHEKLRECYAKLVSQHGLFDEVDAARRFASDIDHLVPEHAPFILVELFVCGKGNVGS